MSIYIFSFICMTFGFITGEFVRSVVSYIKKKKKDVYANGDYDCEDGAR